MKKFLVGIASEFPIFDIPIFHMDFENKICMMKIIHVDVFPRRRASPRARPPGAGTTKLSITRGFASDGALQRSLIRTQCDHCSEHAT